MDGIDSMVEQEDDMLRQALDWVKNAVETYRRRRRPNSSMNNVTVTEAAYFDIYPDNDNTGHLGGAWAVYPFFDSGVIAVSDKEAGLYLLRPSLP